MAAETAAQPDPGPPPGRRGEARFCPGCAADLAGPRGFAQEFWSAADRLFFCWCPDCGMTCTVSVSDRVVSHEPAH